jgi:hypothetical protein
VAWETEKITINNSPRSFEVFHQEHTLSCGPACVVMVNRLKCGKVTGETIVRMWFSKVENQKSCKAATPTRVFKWIRASEVETVISVLRTQKIGDPRLTTDMREVANCTPQMPAIAKVAWLTLGPDSTISLGGCHFVVCVGPASVELAPGVIQRSWIYLDPTFGVTVVPQAPPKYFAGGQTATLSDLIMI